MDMDVGLKGRCIGFDKVRTRDMHMQNWMHCRCGYINITTLVTKRVVLDLYIYVARQEMSILASPLIFFSLDADVACASPRRSHCRFLPALGGESDCGWMLFPASSGLKSAFDILSVLYQSAISMNRKAAPQDIGRATHTMHNDATLVCSCVTTGLLTMA